MVQVLESTKLARVGLIGNPNTGKSTIFNRLTGLRQRIANYPGITVEERIGTTHIGKKSLQVVDLPGAYSLSASTLDERAVLDALTARGGREPLDLLVCVLDATNLERNLFLALQIADFGLPMILVLNQWDVLRRRNQEYDLEKLKEILGIPVLPVSARSGEGMKGLETEISKVLEKPCYLAPTAWSREINTGLEDLIGLAPGLSRGEALRLIFDGGSLVADRWSERKGEIQQRVGRIHSEIAAGGMNPGPAEALIQYKRIGSLLEGVIDSDTSAFSRSSETIDRILLHRVWGLGIFVAVMWVVFQSVYSWASPMMDGLEWLTGALQEGIRPVLSGLPVLESLVVDGIIAGVGGVIVFVPQIFVLFLFIALLEDTGYMARAAFLMDKALGWCGLNGKSFVPLLSSYACAIPGIMAARTLEDKRSRVTTILMAPFMSCSARLPVYVLFIGAFVEPAYGAMVAGWTLFLLHFVGLAVAAFLAWISQRLFSSKTITPFVLEMPQYKVPQLRNIFIRVWGSGREFIVRAGTVIFAFSILIWALLYFPHSESVSEAVEDDMVRELVVTEGLNQVEAMALLKESGTPAAIEFENRLQASYREDSYLGRFGHFVQPVFAPAGFDWKLTVGVLSSFPARELVISTLGIIYQLGPDVDAESQSLRNRIVNEKWPSGSRVGQSVYTMPVVLAVLVFFALCLQCGATVAIIAKELNGWIALGSFVGMTVLAWVAAVAVYQIGTLISGTL